MMPPDWFNSSRPSVPKLTASVADVYPLLEKMYGQFKESESPSTAFKMPDLETTMIIGEWVRFVFDGRERAVGLRNSHGDHFVVISSDEDNLTAGIKFDELIYCTGRLGDAWTARFPKPSLLKQADAARDILSRSMFISDVGVAYYFRRIPAATLPAQSGALWHAIFASDFSLGDAAGSIYPHLSSDLLYVEPFPDGQDLNYRLSQDAVALSEKLDTSAEFRAEYLAVLKSDEPKLRDSFLPEKTRFDVCKQIRDSLYQQYFLTVDTESSSGGSLQNSIAALSRVIDWIAPSFENQVAWQRHAKQAQNFMRLRNLHARSGDESAAARAREGSLVHLRHVPVRFPADTLSADQPTQSGAYPIPTLQRSFQQASSFPAIAPQALSLGAYFMALHPGAGALQMLALAGSGSGALAY